MKPTLEQGQVRHILDKIGLLKNEYQARKTAGEKRIWKEQLLLEANLQKIEIQIKRYEKKIAESQST